MGAYFVYGNSQTPLYFDVVLTESPSFPTEITEHVVEDGADITDHVRVGLKSVALEVFVTNEPLNNLPQFGVDYSTSSSGPFSIPSPSGQPLLIPGQPLLQGKEWVTLPLGVPIIGALYAHEGPTLIAPDVGLGPSAPVQVNPNILTFPTQFDAVQGTHDLLDKLRTDVQLISIYGTKAIYDNMVIEHFSMTRSSETGSGATFSIQLKEIRKVASAIVTLPTPAKPRGSPPIAKGSQSTEPIKAGQKAKSVAKVLGSILSGSFFNTTPTVP